MDLFLRATAWDAKPGRMKETDPTWIALAQELEKPRPIGKESKLSRMQK